MCVRCPAGWFNYENECYYISFLKTDWHNAKIGCWKKKSNLLIIDSDLVVDFSKKFFTNNRLTGSYFVFFKNIFTIILPFKLFRLEQKLTHFIQIGLG